MSPVSNGSVLTVRTTSLKGVQFIVSWEGKFFSKPHDVEGTNKRLTIGYGHVILKGENKDKYTKGIDRAQAEAILRNDLLKYESLVKRLIKVPLKQHQFDALVSYIFNTGSLQNTKLLSHLNKSEYDEAVLEMDIITADGKPMKGLIKRRNAEQKMFKTGFYQFNQ